MIDAKPVHSADVHAVALGLGAAVGDAPTGAAVAAGGFDPAQPVTSDTTRASAAAARGAIPEHSADLYGEASI